ncbi:MAG: hypothetical protein EOO09_16825 [Chitinophagaceae bacterium]|nr:MAG: hypothetical protein EOO09_16825 [Chitinophagaceae bacterium]
MRVLFIGDSITNGSRGVSFTKLVRVSDRSLTIVNKGVNGEPLYNIADRLIRLLKKDAAFDHIIIQAGINDLLLPELEKRGGLFKWSVGRERKHDTRPLDDPQKFRTLYTVLLKEIRHYSKAKVTLVNISRINEEASPQFLALQRSFNEVIADLAGQANYRLADVSGAFEEILSKQANTPYLCEGFWNTSLFDWLRCLLPGGADKLAVKRGLRLTIDGVHLNSSGARIYAVAISGILREITVSRNKMALADS